MSQGNFKKWNRITVGDCLTFPVNLQLIPSSHSLLSRDKRLPLDMWKMSGSQENVSGNQLSTFDSSRNHHQEIHHCTTPKETGSVPQAIGTGTSSFARDDERIRKHSSNADICKQACNHEILQSCGYSAEFYGWTAKTADIGTASRQVLCTFYILMLEDEIQKPSEFFFF